MIDNEEFTQDGGTQRLQKPYWLLGMCLLCITAALTVSFFLSGASPVECDDKSSFGELGVATMRPNAENVVASELLGTWESDGSLSKQLGRTDKTSVTVQFAEDGSAEERILLRLTTYISEVKSGAHSNVSAEGLERALQAVYIAGVVTYTQVGHDIEADYALTSVAGNPYVFVHYRDRDIIDSAIVMLARDEAGDGDILFLGGSKNNQSLRAFKRTNEEAKED